MTTEQWSSITSYLFEKSHFNSRSFLPHVIIAHCQILLRDRIFNASFIDQAIENFKDIGWTEYLIPRFWPSRNSNRGSKWSFEVWKCKQAAEDLFTSLKMTQIFYVINPFCASCIKSNCRKRSTFLPTNKRLTFPQQKQDFLVLWFTYNNNIHNKMHVISSQSSFRTFNNNSQWNKGVLLLFIQLIIANAG